MPAFATFRRSLGLSSSPSKSSQQDDMMVTTTTTTMTTSMMHNEQIGKRSPTTTKGNIRTIPANSINPLSASTSSSNPSSSEQNALPVLASLMLENSHGQDKVAYPIRKEVTKIGRLPTNDIRIYRETVSRVHCQIVIDTFTSGQATLHVLNPRGVKVNGREVDVEKNGKRQFVLREGDRLEIFRNYFRMCYPVAAAADENSAPTGKSTSLPRKSLRMSLVRASVVQSSSDSSSSSPHRAPLQELQAKDRPEQRQGQYVDDATQSTHDAKDATELIRASSSAKPVRKGRRSLVFSTPKREVVSSIPWTTEPMKRQPAAGDDFVSKLQTYENRNQSSKGRIAPSHREDSVVVLEEMEDEDEYEEEQGEQEVGKDSCLQEPFEEIPMTPASLSPTKGTNEGEVNDDRLTKSASPTKKARRRSSFFGRSGVFGSWNFGFYPEERSAAAAMGEALDSPGDADDMRPSTPVTSPNGSVLLPEPRLDNNGRPRLPRSLSSPEGVSSSSPKRRVVSLRTATLLRQGQHAYEQQKLRSPPSSPTKIRQTESSVSLMDAMRRMMTSSPPPEEEKDDEQNDLLLTAKAADVSKFSSDADDEDEVNRSLNIDEDEEDAEDLAEEKVDEATSSNASRGLTKPRRSESVVVPGRGDSGQRPKKPRTSMPAKLVSFSLVDGHAMEDIEDLKAQWIAEQNCDEGNAVALAPIADEESGSNSDTDSEIEDATSPITLKTLSTTENKSQDQHASPSSEIKFGMLRYMVRENPDLSALLDSVVGDVSNGVAEDYVDVDKQAEEPDEAVLPQEEEPVEPIVVDEMSDTEAIEEMKVEEGEWQIIPPRRSTWKAVERSMANVRRASEGPKELNNSSPRKAKRRITAAPMLASAAPLRTRRSVTEKEGEIDNKDAETIEDAQDNFDADQTEQIVQAPEEVKNEGASTDVAAEVFNDVQEEFFVETPSKAGRKSASRRQSQAKTSSSSKRAASPEDKHTHESTANIAQAVDEVEEERRSKSSPLVGGRKSASGRQSQPAIRSPIKRGASADGITEHESVPVVEATADGTTEARSSPSKRAKKRADTQPPAQEHAPLMHVGRPRKERAAKTAAVEAILNSPKKARVEPSMTEATSPGKRSRATPSASASSKGALRELKNVTTPVKAPSLSSVASSEPDGHELGVALLSSSPSKRTRRAIKLQGGNAAQTSHDKANVSPTKKRQTTAATRSTRKAGGAVGQKSTKDDIASEPILSGGGGGVGGEGEEEQSAPRTTRSGRAIRKPTDRGGLATVISVPQTDPAPVARSTRSRRAVKTAGV